MQHSSFKIPNDDFAGTITNKAPLLKNRKEHPDNESIDVKQAQVVYA